MVTTIRVLLVLALVPLSFYLLPRVVNLVAVPTGLDRSLAHGAAYNPRLASIAEQEEHTLARFEVLDRMDAALARVRGTDAEVAVQLTTLVGRIRHDVIPVLGTTNDRVARLLGALDELETGLDDLREPVGDIGATVRDDRAQLGAILREARSTAGSVSDARGSAESGADHVSGPRGDR